MTEDNYTEIGKWLISHYEATMKRKEYKEANVIFSLILDFAKIHDMPTLKDEALKRVGIKDVKLDKAFSTPIGEQVKEVFYEIDKLRGYRPPKRNAEAASIQRMIKKGYNSKQILECWHLCHDLVRHVKEEAVDSALRNFETKKNKEQVTA